MEFGGTLSIIPPHTVLQTFCLSSLTGMLRFVTKGNKARFYFNKGRLVFATMETREKKIGSYLVEKGHITQEQLECALDQWFDIRGKSRIGEILVEQGYIDRQCLITSLQEQMEEVVYEVLTWNQGYFIYFNNDIPKNQDILLDMQLDHLLLEGTKRIDDKNRAPT